MKATRILCILLALLLPTCALASDLEAVIAALPDEDLITLCSIAMVEAYNRGLSSQELAAAIAEQNAAYQQRPTPAPDASKPIRNGTMQSVRDVLVNSANAETIPAYSNISTPKPTFAPLIVLEDTDPVWISKTGKRYHTVPDCSGMSTARKVTLDEALANGLTPCRDCAYWMTEMEY